MYNDSKIILPNQDQTRESHQNILKNENNNFGKKNSNSSIKILSLPATIDYDMKRKSQKNKHELTNGQNDNIHIYYIKNKYVYYIKNKSKQNYRPSTTVNAENSNKKTNSRNNLIQNTKELLKVNSVFDVHKNSSSGRSSSSSSHNSNKEISLPSSNSQLLDEHRQIVRTPQPQLNNNNVYSNIYNISIPDKSNSSEEDDMIITSDENDSIVHGQQKKNIKHNDENEDPIDVMNDKNYLLKKYEEHLDINYKLINERDNEEKPSTSSSLKTNKKPKKIKKKSKKRLDKSKSSLNSSKEFIIKEKDGKEILKIKKSIKKMSHKDYIKATDSLESLESINYNSDISSIKKIKNISKSKKKIKKEVKIKKKIKI